MYRPSDRSVIDHTVDRSRLDRIDPECSRPPMTSPMMSSVTVSQSRVIHVYIPVDTTLNDKSLLSSLPPHPSPASPLTPDIVSSTDNYSADSRLEDLPSGLLW